LTSASTAARWSLGAVRRGDIDLDDLYDRTVPARPKHELARGHFESAQRALREDDLVVAITFLHLAAEAAVVDLADRHGIETKRRHELKAKAATSLYETGHLPDDLGPDLRALNELRKDVTYEGEDVELPAHELNVLAARVGAAVTAAEEAAS
jgi:hypothetical protein